MTQPDDGHAPHDPLNQPAVPQPMGEQPPPPPMPPSQASGPVYGYPEQYPTGQYPTGQVQPYAPQGQTQYQYGAPPQYGYAPPPPKNDLGVWSLVTGILSWILCPLILGIVAIFTGNASRRAVREGLANNPGSATAGLILGWINVGLVGVFVLWWVAIVIFGLLGAAFSVSQA